MIFIIIINIILLKINIVSSWWSQSQIRSVMNKNKCLDIGGGKNIAGANIQIWDCHNDWQQSWFYDILTKEIKNMNPIGIEYCLDLENGNTADGTNIRIWKCDGSNGQKWQLNNDFTITNIINGKCLDIYNLDDNNGANVKLYTCNGGNNQLWRLISEIKSVLNGKCLTVEGGIQSSGKNIEMYECDKAYGQKWYYDKNTKQIANYYVNGLDLCLQVDVTDNNNVILSTCSSSIEQKWILNEDETITNYINNNLCLTIDGYNYNNHANVVLSPCNPVLFNQRWFGTFIPMKSPQELIIRETFGTAYDWIWNDVGSGSTLDGSYWKPKIYSTEAFISFVNVISHNAPYEQSMIIMRYPLDALANPIGYDLIWDDSGSRGKYSVWVYRPIAPPGYICYGDYVQAHNSDIPTTADGYKCIHSRYVHFDNEELATSQELYWNDIKSGADDSIQIVKIITNHHFPHQYYRSYFRHLRYISFPWGALELIPIDETSYIEIKSVMNGKCLDITNGVNIVGTNVQMYECNNIDSAQKWKYNPSTQEFNTIHGKCLSLEGGWTGDNDGTNVHIWNCNGDNAQKWLINPDHTISNINGGCLDILDYNTANNANVKLYRCHGGKNQIWIGGDIFGIQDINKFAVERFAPILRFDQYGSDYGLPMNVQKYTDSKCRQTSLWQGNIEVNGWQLVNCQNKVLDLVNNPTYYDILHSNIIHGDFDIQYWWYYGYQYDCMAGQGSHVGDWERIQVHIKNWDIVSVTYFQHAGYYTAPLSYLELDANHFRVYVGKIGHGSYYDDRDGIGGGCGYFFDWRNPNGQSKYAIHTWDNLIQLRNKETCDDTCDQWMKENIDPCIDLSCANVLTGNKGIRTGCEDTGCEWKKCDSDSELMRYPTVCAGL